MTYECNKNEIQNCIHQLTEVIDLIDSNIKPIFYHYLSVYYKDTNKFDKAIYYLQLSLNFDFLTTSMVYYHMSMIYRRKSQNFKSYYYITQAKELFIKTNNYMRSALSDFIIANIHASNDEYLTNYNRMHAPVF